MRPEQVAAEAAAFEAQQKADRSWKPLLARWKAELRDGSRRERARDHLSGVTDPLAVPSIWAVFARGGPDDQAVAIRLLGQVDGPGASRGLALLAVFGPSAETRRAAIETLARRDPRDVVGLLIDLLVDPVRYEVHPVGGPGAPGALLVERERFNLRRLYTVPPLPESTIRRILDPTTLPDTALPIAATLGEGWARLAWAPMEELTIWRNRIGIRVNLALAARATLAARQRLDDDTRLIEVQNRVIGEANRRVEAPLHALTGQDLGQDREAWRAWWTDQQGYSYAPTRRTPRPTIDEEVPLPDPPRYRPVTGCSCFAAGTPVLTRDGARPIETIRLGDVVLTQDPGTGALNLAPVLAVFHNPPAPTLRIRLDDEAIEATGIHRFWVAGHGWVMARDLKPGDRVRTRGGQSPVAAVEPGTVQPVFNLAVGEDQSFFAGRAGALVHDNSLVTPVPRPFDAVADLPAQATDR